ncbi:MAG: hypothetical protein ACM3UZ_13790 [Acidobacteriota bacterium]
MILKYSIFRDEKGDCYGVILYLTRPRREGAAFLLAFTDQKEIRMVDRC